MKKMLCLLIIVSLFANQISNAYAAYDNERIEKVWNTMSQRQQAIINDMAANPFPNPVGGSGIGMVIYALTNLYNNEDLEKCEEYLLYVNDKFNYRIPHTGDFETYFQMTIMLRIWYLFNEKSLYYPGRLTKKAEDAILDYFMGFIESNSKVEYAQKHHTDIYHMQATGNHHVIKRCMYLLGNQALMLDERYKDTKLSDGYTVSEHYKAWEEYWKQDIVFRGKKALEIEFVASGYYKYTMDVFMTIRDFAQSSIIRDLAQKYLDVIFSDIAVQSNNGLYGGARGRSTRSNDSDTTVEVMLLSKWFNTQSSWRIPGAIDPFSGNRMDSLYHNSANSVKNHPNLVSSAMSCYTPIQPIADLVLNYQQRGTYEYISTPPGRGGTLSSGWFYLAFPSRYQRYTYVTPSYILGSYTYDRALEYTDVMGQNKQMGIHFTTPDKQSSLQSRVFPDSERDYSRGFNDLNGVGYKGTILVQGLPEARYYNPALHSDVFIGFTKDIYQTATEEDGWMFGYVPDGSGYIAVKPAKGAIKGWKKYSSDKNVMGLHFTEKQVPIILQAGSKEEYGSYDNFKKEVKLTRMKWNNQTEFEYNLPLSSDTIAWYVTTQIPKINGKPLELEPEKMISSPYLNSVWGSGVFNITNQKNEKYTVRMEYDESDEVGLTRAKPSEWVDDWNGAKLKVNGSFLSCKQPPVIEGDEIFLPLRPLFQFLDAKILWDEQSQSVHLELEGDVFIITVGSRNAILNGKKITLDAAPSTINGNTMIPMRFFADYFGAKVKWDEENNTVVVWKGLKMR